MATAVKLRQSGDGKRVIAVDQEVAKEILRYISQSDRHKKKFQDIVNIILGGHRNTNLYDKEDIDEKSKAVRAMKFFKGQENDRIYCQEVTLPDGTNVVVMAALREKKKGQGLKQVEKNLIHSVAEKVYEKVILK